MFKIPRINAFLIHLAISFIIFLVPVYLIAVYWYPLPYFFTDGGWRGIIIIVGAYLVLGPLLTLLVYKPAKAGLKFDLTFIGLIQVAALSWGFWVAYTERPIAMVYTLNYFTPVSEKLLTKMEFPLNNLASFGDNMPVPVYVDLPLNFEQRQKYLARAISSGVPLYLFTNLYKKFDPESLQILKQNSDQLYKHLESNEEGKQLLNTFYQVHPELYNRYLFIPLHSRYKRQVIVLDADNLSYKGSLDIEVTDFILGRTRQKTPKPSQGLSD